MQCWEDDFSSRPSSAVLLELIEDMIDNCDISGLNLATGIFVKSKREGWRGREDRGGRKKNRERKTDKIEFCFI